MDTTHSTSAASALGIKSTRPNASKRDSKQSHLIHEELQALLADPQGSQRITAFEQDHRLPPLKATAEAPYAREIRYLLTSDSGPILIEAARNITYPPLWYALAGLK